MTIAEFKKQMTDDYIANAAIREQYKIQVGDSFEDHFSPVSAESIFFYIVAAAHWLLYSLFGQHDKEVNTLIDNKKPSTIRWYRNVAKLFQYGDNLAADTDTYDNTNKTPEQIAASCIVAHASITDMGKDGLIVKMAKESGGDLAPLTDTELAAFREYYFRATPAGVYKEYISAAADELKLSVKIHYNPLVLDASGRRLDGQQLTPVDDAIRAYLKKLPFDGTFALAFLTDALQAVDGVVIPTIEIAQYKYADLTWAAIDIMYLPFAGYMRIDDENLKIEYVAQSEII